MTLDRSIKLLKVSILLFFFGFELYFIYRWYDKIEQEELAAKESGHYIVAIDEVITVKMGERIMNALDKKERNGELQSLMVVLDTPGGSPVASENLYRYFKELGARVPLYMYVNSAAASGGYYIAVASPKIYANKNALVGSVGVLMQNLSLAKMAEELGVSDETLSAGEFKHLLSPLKTMDEKTKRYFEEYLLQPIYDNFAQTVADERGIAPAQQSEYFEGRIFIAGDKRIHGVLVDALASYPDMVELVQQEQKTQTLTKLDYKPKVSGVLSQLLETFNAADPGIQFK